MNRNIDILKRCKFFVFDFDGVMTDNRVLVLQDGTEAVFCNRSDGLGIEIIKKAGYSMLILSSEVNPIVEPRAKKLGVEVIYGSKNKKTSLKNYCDKHNINLKDVCFVGNDINDLEVMLTVGYAISPSDAYDEIREISHYITKSKGGEGVIRELSQILSGAHYNG